MSLIEKDSKNIEDHIAYWEAIRKENVISYYARKEHMGRLGLQPLPTTAVSEHRAKEAIKMQIYLRSLARSQYGREPWTLTECSAEMFNAPPRDCFKKKPIMVTVWFDNDEKNSFPYTAYEYIYYKDDNDVWYKVQGLVDHDGLYFKEHTGDTVYYQLFQPDALKYGTTGQWTVKFKNQTVLASVTSSTRSFSKRSEVVSGGTTSHASTSKETSRGGPVETSEDSSSPSSTTPRLRSGRRRRQQGEYSSESRPKRPRVGSDTAPTPDEVGRRSQSVAAHGLSRLRRLQEEARDPPIILITGRQNTLKCWRNRCKENEKISKLFMCCSSVWKWLGTEDNGLSEGKMLIAFKTTDQRTAFINSVTLPKHCTLSLGKLDSL